MVTICPKCGKKAWKPYKFVIKGKSGKNYTYLVYRHNEKKRHTPRKCYVAQRKKPARVFDKKEELLEVQAQKTLGILYIPLFNNKQNVGGGETPRLAVAFLH